MAVFSETSPRPGRRNAMPDIFQGLTPDRLQQLKELKDSRDAGVEGDAEQQQQQQQPQQEDDEVLDIVHSSRYRQRRNAISAAAINNYHC